MFKTLVTILSIVQLAKSSQLPVNHKMLINATTDELLIPVKVVQEKLDNTATKEPLNQTTTKSPMIVEAISSNTYPLEPDHSWKLSKSYAVSNSDERSNTNKPLSRKDSYLDALEISQGKKSADEVRVEPKTSKVFRRDYKQQVRTLCSGKK